MKAVLDNSFIRITENQELFADSGVEIVVDFSKHQDPQGSRIYHVDAIFMRAYGEYGPYSADITDIVSKHVKSFIESMILHRYDRE